MGVCSGVVGADCVAAVTEAALECVSEALAAAEAACLGTQLGELELEVGPTTLYYVAGLCQLTASASQLQYLRPCLL